MTAGTPPPVESGGLFLRRLRAVSVIVAVAGAVLSLRFMAVIGARQRSGMLIAMFAIWVLAPFVALVVADWVWKQRPAAVRLRLYAVMLLVTAASLAVYGEVAFGPPRPKPARFFLMVPLLSWVVIALTTYVTRTTGRKR